MTSLRTRLLAALFLPTLLIAGCGGDDGSDRVDGVSLFGIVVAGGLGATVGQVARSLAGQASDVEGDLGGQLATMTKDLVRVVTLVVAMVAAYWLTLVAGLVGIIFLIASFVCINGEPLNGGGATNGALALGLVAASVTSMYFCIIQLDRLHRRARSAIEADIDLGVPLLGAGRLWVASTAIATMAGYAVVTQGLG